MWLDVAQDLDFHRAILDGTWPGSEKILEKSLEKAKIFAEKERNGERK